MTKRKTQTYRGINFIRHEPFTLKQTRNLIDMAHAIQNSPPPKFNMSDWGSVDEENLALLPKSLVDRISGDLTWYGTTTYISPKEMRNIHNTGHVCGTSCCAIGTAAFHGVGKLREDWDDYAYETFGVEAYGSVWSFLFDSTWSGIDNTPEGAVARILCLVEHGPNYIVENHNDDFLDVSAKNLYKDFLGVKIHG